MVIECRLSVHFSLLMSETVIETRQVFFVEDAFV